MVNSYLCTISGYILIPANSSDEAKQKASEMSIDNWNWDNIEVEDEDT